MSLETELRNFFSEEITSVVDDADRFRRKLSIGSEAFKYLTQAENLGSFTTALSTGAGVASLCYIGWMASIGTLGQIGLAIGFVATPVGWIAAAGAGGAAAVFLARRVLQSMRKDTVTEVPNFINTPLDLLGVSICDFMCPVLLKVAHADGDVAPQEEEKIKSYFTDQWGINPRYVDSLLKSYEDKIRNFEWNGLSTTLLEIEKTGDLKYEAMASEILSIATEVMTCDGTIHELEAKEIEKLQKALHRDNSFLANLKTLTNNKNK